MRGDLPYGVQPNRKGGFYLYRDRSPLVKWIPGNFHSDISAVIEQAPTPDTFPIPNLRKACSVRSGRA